MKMVLALTVSWFCLLWALGLVPGEEAEVAVFRGNPQQTGAFEKKGPATAPRVKWRFGAAKPIYSPSLYGNVLLCVCREPAETPCGSSMGLLYAVDAENGKELWKFCRTGAPVVGLPAVTGDKVFFGTAEGILYSVRLRDGLVSWERQVGAAITTPVVLSNGSLYLGTADGYIHSQGFENETAWKLELSQREINEPEIGNIWAAPAVDQGILYVSTTGEYLFAVRLEDRKVLWKTSVQYMYVYMLRVSSRVAVADDSILFAKDLKHLYCVRTETGKVKWTFEVKSPFVSHFATRDGLVYLSSQDGFLYALDIESGNVKWKFKPSAVPGDLSVGLERVYFGTAQGTVYALDKDSGKQIWAVNVASAVCESPVVGDSVLYVSTIDGDLYALEGGPKGGNR